MISKSQRIINFEDDQKVFEHTFPFRDLIQEDWRDFVTSFYFPKVCKAISDQRIKEFIERTNAELVEIGQQPHVIELLVTKAYRFIE